MSHLYGTGEITIAWQFAYCLVGNLFLEATTRSIEIIDGDDFLLEHHLFCHPVRERVSARTDAGGSGPG